MLEDLRIKYVTVTVSAWHHVCFQQQKFGVIENFFLDSHSSYSLERVTDLKERWVIEHKIQTAFNLEHIALNIFITWLQAQIQGNAFGSSWWRNWSSTHGVIFWHKKYHHRIIDSDSLILFTNRAILSWQIPAYIEDVYPHSAG